MRLAHSRLLLAALFVAGCAATGTESTPAAGASPRQPPTATSPTATKIPEPGAEPAEERAAADADLAVPLGPHPSFNESAGCGSLQGYRGPFVAAAGDQSDGVVIAGPWGDYFGRTIGDVRGHLVLMELPTVGDDTDNRVWVHERVAPALNRVINDLREHQVMGFSYRIEVTSSFRPSTVPPHRYLSFHAVGAAIDINPAANPYRDDNVLITDLPEWFVQIWRDAGWCWGGDWQDIKDPMHFSWRGPLHDPGHEPIQPYAPSTQPAPYRRSLSFRTHLGAAPPGSVQLVADVDRDGAPDAIRVSAWTETGRLGVEAARARHAYSTCWASGVTAGPSLPGATLLLADRTGDGRPDLWEIGSDGSAVALTVHAYASGYRAALEAVVIPVAADAETLFLAGDHDRDGVTDLYVVSPGDPVHVEILAGLSFRSMLTATVPIAASSEWRFALGDHDGDAVPDLFALGPEDPAILVIQHGADDFTAEPATITTGISRHEGSFQVADLDGDGRGDLVFFEPNGVLTAYLGGDQGDATDAQLTSWFSAGSAEPWADGQSWSPGSGCRQVPGRPGRS
jgi:hypothetical protein